MHIDLTFASRAGLAVALALAGCNIDPPTSSGTSANPSDTSDDGSGGAQSGADDSAAAGGSTSATTDQGLDAGKHTSDGGSADDGGSAKDAGATAKDAGLGGLDAGLPRSTEDASAPLADAGKGAELDGATAAKDAGEVAKDAASALKDASSKDAASVDPQSACSGDTPHGCYVARDDNPMGCPDKIHEQSAFYPPMEEWVACSSPYYTPCNYQKPGGGDDAHCECDLGLHWLCTY